jgi:multisubunit Na+/H+ antiporter MnhF subunit
MTTYVLVASLVLLGIALVLTLVRFSQGPFLVDRIAAFELFMVILAASLMILGLLYDLFVLLEIAGFAVVASFFGTVALTSFVSKEKK